MKSITRISITSILIVLLSVSFAFAGSAAPWDSGIDRFINLFTGKVSLGIFFVIFLAAVSKLMAGGELDELTRKMLIGTIGVSGLIAVSALFNLIFGTAGALIL